MPRSRELFVGMVPPKVSTGELFDVETQETPRKHRRSSRECCLLEPSILGCSTVKNDRFKRRSSDYGYTMLGQASTGTRCCAASALAGIGREAHAVRLL